MDVSVIAHSVIDRPCRTESGNAAMNSEYRLGKRESLHFVERRLLSASSLQSKLRTLGIHVADDAMVDVLGMCLYASPLKVI